MKYKIDYTRMGEYIDINGSRCNLDCCNNVFYPEDYSGDIHEYVELNSIEEALKHFNILPYDYSTEGVRNLEVLYQEMESKLKKQDIQMQMLMGVVDFIILADDNSASTLLNNGVMNRATGSRTISGYLAMRCMQLYDNEGGESAKRLYDTILSNKSQIIVEEVNAILSYSGYMHLIVE